MKCTIQQRRTAESYRRTSIVGVYVTALAALLLALVPALLATFNVKVVVGLVLGMPAVGVKTSASSSVVMVCADADASV